MKKILIIDDCPTILKAFEIKIVEANKDIQILSASTYSQANELIRQNKNKIYAAIVDLNLPDCKSGKAALLTNSHKIPTIVFTGTDDENLKSLLLKKDILDYIQKDSPDSIQYAIDFITRVIRNNTTTAIIVDDSKLSRQIFKTDLEKLRINVLEACDAQEALDIIKTNEKQISLVLIDYYMPNMDGVQLTKILRKKYKKDTLSIIAISGTEDETVLTKFIKAGANDFLAKPHKFEELNVRIHSNLDILELFQKTKDLANRDFLTGAYNRRYFFETCEAILKKNIKQKSNIALITIDIDNFKTINDNYGHNIGDIAIKEVIIILAKILKPSDLLARFGGEEFCILIEDITLKDAEILFEKIRLNFELNKIKLKEVFLKYTVSLGVAHGKIKNINDALKISDNALYEAKKQGRNRVIVHQV
ncbi:MAG: diguanylate cyclase [Campylobacterota bacterium]|nr:diguanylate cyclase [Campylobacterota bacterium]